jgi:hypothetical protein
MGPLVSCLFNGWIKWRKGPVALGLCTSGFPVSTRHYSTMWQRKRRRLLSRNKGKATIHSIIRRVGATDGPEVQSRKTKVQYCDGNEIMKGVNSNSGFNITRPREKPHQCEYVHVNCIVSNYAFGKEGSLCFNFVGFTGRCKTEGMSVNTN